MRSLLVIALACLCACSSEPSTSHTKTLRIQIAETPESFDPREARSLNAMTVAKMLYDGLTRIGPEGQPIPSVAEVIEVSDDGRTYTFHLRESLWCDGSVVEAKDFARTWEAIRSGSCASPHGFMFSCVETVSVLDEQTLVVELTRPTPYFLELTAASCYLPYKAEGLTNGPFELERFSPDDILVLEKSNSYWDRDSVQLEKIVLPVVADETTALALFDQGELDWVGSPLGSLPAELVPDLREKGKLHTWDTAATLWYKLNTRRAPLNHPKVRRAMALAIDRQALVDHVVPLGQKIATAPVPPLMGLQKGPLFDDGNESQAAQLFEEALSEMGITRSQLPRLSLLCGNSGRYRQLAQALQQQWRSCLGLDVQLEACEFKVLLTRMRQGDYDLAGKIWFADFNDPTSFLDMYRSSGDSMNETGWEDARFAALMAQAEAQTDPNSRQALLAEAEALLVSEMPIIPVYHHALVYLKTPQIEGVVLPAVSQADFKWAKSQ